MDRLDKTYFSVKAENRQFEEALAFIQEVLRLHNSGESGINAESIMKKPQAFSTITDHGPRVTDHENTTDNPALLSNSLLSKVQIAGTNGKGSTAAMLTSILMQAGYKTGLYTSPSLVCVNERIRLNGNMISDEELEGYIPVIEQAQMNIGRQFGGFERITAASMLYYLDNAVDIAIMETGLGGRYDTVSAVPGLILASITSIGLDHMVMLGNTISQIAWEKCGIMRETVPTVVHSQVSDAEGVIENCAKELNSQLIKTSSAKILSATTTQNGQQLTVLIDDKEYKLLVKLAGDYQRENAINAVLCALELRKQGYNITDRHIEQGIANTSWEGRLQELSINSINSKIVVDGAHNPHAMASVAKYIKNTSDNKPIVLLSVMADKDIDGVLEQVKVFCDTVVCVSITERSCRSAQLAQLSREHGLIAYEASSVLQGLQIADELAMGTTVYALGSLYLVGKILGLKEELC